VARQLLRREVVFDRLVLTATGGQMGHRPAAVLDRDLELVVLEEDPVLIPTA
jgi:hypothetical protein